jgi:hypothetical protein
MLQSNLYAILLLLVIMATTALVTRFGQKPKFFRYFLSIIGVVPHYFVCLLFVHASDEGQPSFVVSGFCAYFLILYVRKLRVLFVGNIILIFYTFLMSFWYVSIVHSGEKISGNPNFKSTDFWHSKLTNIYPATSESRKEGLEQKIPKTE